MSTEQFSKIYIDMYSKCRSGNLDTFQQLQAMSNEGDDIAKGYYALILMRSTVITIPRDQKRANILFQEIISRLRICQHDENASERAHVWYLLATCLMEDVGIGKDEIESLRLYNLAAKRGHPFALCDLGLCYDVGIGVERNSSKSLACYENSAAQGYHVALRNVAICYEFGLGCQVDVVKAHQYTKIAVEKGSIEAIERLASHLICGKGVDRCVKKGVEYFKMGADLGDLDCAYALGNYYMTGLDVAKDEALGFRLLLSAADLNHYASLIFVAKCYRRGKGVETNIIEAVRYLRRALKHAEYSVLKRPLINSERILALLDDYDHDYKNQVSYINCVDFLSY